MIAWKFGGSTLIETLPVAVPAVTVPSAGAVAVRVMRLVPTVPKACETVRPSRTVPSAKSQEKVTAVSASVAVRVRFRPASIDHTPLFGFCSASPLMV